MSTAAARSSTLKIADRVRNEGLTSACAHYRTVALHHAWSTIDRHRHPSARDDGTADKVELDTVTIASPNRSIGVHYLPTPWRVLDWVHAALPEPMPGTTFIDYGCGKGRVVLSATARPYQRVVGVEFAVELAEAAREIVANLNQPAAGSVEIHQGDATLFEIPETPIVAFLFNPFGPPVIERVAANLSRSWRKSPRPMIVAYLNPVHETAFAAVRGFSRLRLPLMSEARFRCLSPYRFAVYATPEALAVMAPESN